MNLPEQVQLAARILELRDTAERIAGAKYPERSEGWKVVVKRWCKTLDCEPMAGVPRIIAAMHRAGQKTDEFDLMWLTAAAVELTTDEHGGKRG